MLRVLVGVLLIPVAPAVAEPPAARLATRVAEVAAGQEIAVPGAGYVFALRGAGSLRWQLADRTEHELAFGPFSDALPAGVAIRFTRGLTLRAHGKRPATLLYATDDEAAGRTDRTPPTRSISVAKGGARSVDGPGRIVALIGRGRLEWNRPRGEAGAPYATPFGDRFDLRGHAVRYRNGFTLRGHENATARALYVADGSVPDEAARALWRRMKRIRARMSLAEVKRILPPDRLGGFGGNGLVGYGVAPGWTLTLGRSCESATLSEACTARFLDLVAHVTVGRGETESIEIFADGQYRYMRWSQPATVRLGVSRAGKLDVRMLEQLRPLFLKETTFSIQPGGSAATESAAPEPVRQLLALVRKRFPAMP